MGDLHAAVHPDIFQGAEELFIMALLSQGQTAHRKGRQGVVCIEPSRHSHPDPSA